MIFDPCVLIPIYNHKDTIRATVGRLVLHGLPVFIVDDGSDEATQQVLVTLAIEYPLITLSRLSQNGGKGAAVMCGLRAARAAGFSHALQIDADGQHDTSDVPRFLEQGMAHPAAVICGRPVYDASVPKGRLYGRYITHFWVWVETLSLSIGDSMCGFRLYPLDTACALIDEVRIPTRMDFDTAIAVRLAWRGVKFENIATRVTYPANGLSHFNMWRDNVRITWTHTRLTSGMVLRLPLLLWRKFIASSNAGAHWSNLAERGSGLGLRFIFFCYRALGENVARLLLYPIVAYFLLTGSSSRAASLDYLRRINAYGVTQNVVGQTTPGWRGSFYHMLSFAQSGLDKLVAWMGGFDSRRVDFPNQGEFERLLASGRGAVLIGSHLGNLEMTRALATNEHRAIVNAVVYTNHAHRFNAMLARANASFGVNLIQISHIGPGTAISLKEKIDRGELVVIVGDRTPPSEGGGGRRVSQIEFLGKPAPFAQGPFILASLLECSVYLFFCLREGDYYRIYFEPFAERIILPRDRRQERLQDYLRQYARRLEAHCLKAPYQWFNFYDFWRQDAANNPTKASV
ncbi:MAG: glycosyltransferase family 2 protein [Rhodocyclaceae bacterium]|nr:MAG: glycosyltransferase family 2 protein [Rhodocyclaceae bacterium]